MHTATIENIPVVLAIFCVVNSHKHIKCVENFTVQRIPQEFFEVFAEISNFQEGQCTYLVIRIRTRYIKTLTSERRKSN